MGDSLDALLQKLVLDARQREADSRSSAAGVSPADQKASDTLQELHKTLDAELIGSHSEQGSRDSQEDRFSIVPDLCRLYPQIARKIAYFAVFDGHEGAACAEFARSSLHGTIAKHESFPENVPVALKESFVNLDTAFLGPPGVPKDPIQLQPADASTPQYTAGSTAVCAVVDWERNTLYCAHVGDSRALLVHRDGSVDQLTNDHTGRSLTQEQREEIRASGVAMVIGSYIWMTTGGDSQRINRHSVSLEVSRALGDPMFKCGYNPVLAAHGKDVVSALPDVLSQPIEEGSILLLATDGLFKTIPNERAAAVAAAATDLNEAARQLCQEAIDARCGDNTTVVLARLVRR